jgi:plastocyanin
VRVLPVLVLCFTVACDKPAPPSPATPPSPVSEGPIRTGTIEGIVRVDHDDIAPLTGSARGFEKYCGQGPVEIGIYKVDAATKGLESAFVEADGRGAERKSGDIATLDQKACVFTPPLVVTPPGPVVFKNSDSMAHNITIRGMLNPGVTEGFPAGEAISRMFPFDEKLTVRCSIHPWMVAGLVVTRRSMHAVTDAKGRFRIEGVEAGRRKIKVWHVLGEEVTIEADVPPDGVVQVEIPWKPRTGFRAPFGR